MSQKTNKVEFKFNEIVINKRQAQNILDYNCKQSANIEQSAIKGAVPERGFVFFAAFDGTNNDKNAINPKSTTPYSTNVAQLWEQYGGKDHINPHLKGDYYAGLGTRGRSWLEQWMAPAVKKGVINTAKDAYKDFTNTATKWLADNEGPVTVVVTGFSRGVASAAIFSQLLYEKGLVHPKTNELIKVNVPAGVLFDPVATGVDNTNLAFPPNVSNVAVIKARSEYRELFRAMKYSKQHGSAVNCFDMYGNHCDIGGGYDNGLGAVSLEAATKYLQHSGLNISDVPSSRTFRDTSARRGYAVILHTERFNEWHESGRYEDTDKKWDVTNENGFNFRKDDREDDSDILIQPGFEMSFTLYDGSTVPQLQVEEMLVPLAMKRKVRRRKKAAKKRIAKAAKKRVAKATRKRIAKATRKGNARVAKKRPANVAKKRAK